MSTSTVASVPSYRRVGRGVTFTRAVAADVIDMAPALALTWFHRGPWRPGHGLPAMNRHIPLPPASAATIAARKHAEVQMARHGVMANTGQRWHDQRTGVDVVLLGRTTAAWGIAPVNDPTEVRLVPVDEFEEHFTYLVCEHDRACCTTHRTRTSPHKGCILR